MQGAVKMSDEKEVNIVRKEDIISDISEKVNISRFAAALIIDTIGNSVISALQKGERLSITGLGTFKVKIRRARTARNPKTGEAVQLLLRKVPAFQVCEALKRAVK